MSSSDLAISKELSISEQSQQNTIVDSTASDKQELDSLKEIIVAWRQIESEVSSLRQQVSEKKKKQTALEEVILRIMKKNNIGALDLKGSGGRLLYHRKTSKGSLNLKSLTEMLGQHLKSESAAESALKYINDHRGSRVRESILYEKE
jgi:gamma-glutamylcysteine synthetase